MICVVVLCNAHVQSVKRAYHNVRVVVDENGGIVGGFLNILHGHRLVHFFCRSLHFLRLTDEEGGNRQYS